MCPPDDLPVLPPISDLPPLGDSADEPDEQKAIALGLRPSDCPKCNEDDWQFLRLSPNKRAAAWACIFCHREEVIRAATAHELEKWALMPYIPRDVQRAVWRRDKGQCAICGKKEHLEFDHMIPTALGGANTERNIQILCRTCNRLKGKRAPGQS